MIFIKSMWQLKTWCEGLTTSISSTACINFRGLSALYSAFPIECKSLRHYSTRRTPKRNPARNQILNHAPLPYYF